MPRPPIRARLHRVSGVAINDLRKLDRPRGDETRVLCLAAGAIRLDGLDGALADALARRWGGYLCRDVADDPSHTMRVFSAGPGCWITPEPGEHYRIEAFNDAARRVIASYHFALCEETDAVTWRVALREGSDEPAARMLENAVRYVVSRIALEQQGWAMHAASVLREGRAYLFAGPSGAGKSTAAALCGTEGEIGDDFAMLVRRDGDWLVPAMPFNNAGRVDGPPVEGLFPLAGVWRVYQAPHASVERPPRGPAVASLMGCAAFPWTVPEMADILLARTSELVAEGKFAHLHFARDSDLWSVLLC